MGDENQHRNIMVRQKAWWPIKLILWFIGQPESAAITVGKSYSRIQPIQICMGEAVSEAILMNKRPMKVYWQMNLALEDAKIVLEALRQVIDREEAFGTRSNTNI